MGAVLSLAVRRRSASWTARALAALAVLALAWGALSFGAVYPWGYWPLAIAASIVGVLAFPIARVPVPGLGRIAIALAAIAAFIGVQLIPVPGAMLARWSAPRAAFLTQHDLLYSVTGGSASHALSIDRSGTAIGLLCFVAFSLLLIGTARLTSASGASGLVQGIIGFGLVLALIAVIQDMKLTGLTGEGHVVYIYGFWPDPYVNKPFGPYINKNNFAGWMLMALPLAIGYLAGKIVVGLSAVRADSHSRLFWLASNDGAQAIFSAAAALAMGVALVLSMSRSGMLAIAVTGLGAAVLAPGAVSVGRRFARLGGAVLLMVVIAAVVGPNVIARRFADASDASMLGRVGAWQDAAGIIRDFPIAGTGINTFGTAMVLYQRHDPLNYWEEAHNDYLQIIAEGGVVGALLAAVAMALVLVEIRRRFREDSVTRTSTWIRAGAVAGLAAIGIQELVEFSLQIPGNAALFAVLIGVALHRRPARLRTGAHFQSAV